MQLINASQLQRCAAPQHDAGEGAIESCRIAVAGITMELRSNVRGLAAAFGRRFADHYTYGATDFTYNVFENDAGYAMWCDHDGAWQWPYGPLALDAVLFLADAAAISALVHYDDTLASVHAAGVEYANLAAAITADSGGGKTTTALACARAGLRIYSDERVLVRGGTVTPFLRRCSLRDEQMRPYASISWTQLFGDRVVAPPAKLRALFVIKGRGALSVEPIEPALALGSVGRWFACKGDAWHRMARAMTLLRSLHCYAITLGTPQQSAQAIRDVLAELAAG